jgi:hypothetical protein
MEISVMKKAVIVFLFAFLCFEVNSQTVYVGGYYNYNWKADKKACYWVNGTEEHIDGETVDAITVKDGKVYTAGVYRTYLVDIKHPLDSGLLKIYRYWIDGKPYELPDCVNVNAIYVDNNNVYVVGSYEENRGRIRTYWLNGVKQKEPPDGAMRDIAFDNGVLYIAGFYTITEKESEIDIACYWINGKRYELPNSKNFVAHGIKVVNGRKYIGAIDYQNQKACYWIDNAQYTFSNSGDYTNIANKAFTVSNGDVVMMSEKNFWVNGSKQNFKATGFFGYCVAYARGKTYIAGPYLRWDGTACYWIDEKRYNIYGSSGDTVGVNTIYVTE